MKQTVYIASPESQQIHVWNLNHEGALTLTQVVDVPGQVQPMVVSPDKRYLYVGVRPEFRVLAYRIAPDDGALTFAAESALPGSPTHISTDHQGQFVFVGSYNAGNVSVTRLEDGLPVGVVDVVEGLDGCHSANISPDNRTLWVPALKQDRICLFTVSDDGHLVAQDPAEVTTVEGAGPRHMVFHPNEQYAYCVNELNSSVDVWELKDPHGNIECVQTLDMMPENFSDTRCMVTEGVVKRHNPIRVLRDNVVIYEGELESLRRFKDDVNEVRNGMECGIGVKNYNDVRTGDVIEVFEIIEIQRTIA